jgi:4a-hydroxytetrahydrobiopterin dehydratase
MTARARLYGPDIESAMSGLPDWTLDDDRIHREFRFDDFVAAFSFMCGVALLAQQMDHHPDWSNVYNVVRIQLTTHDLGGLSTWDVELARRIDHHYAG